MINHTLSSFQPLNPQFCVGRSECSKVTSQRVGGGVPDLTASSPQSTPSWEQRKLLQAIVAQENHINDDYKGFGERLPSCPRTEHQNSNVINR